MKPSSDPTYLRTMADAVGAGAISCDTCARLLREAAEEIERLQKQRKAKGDKK